MIANELMIDDWVRCRTDKKQFALQKQAEKVAYRPTDEEEAEPTAEPTTPTGGNQGGGEDGMS